MTLPGDWRKILAGCDQAQVAAITSPAAPLLVIAGAGSGKTRVLTRRIAWRIIEEQATAAHVLALTFTRKAAAELRGRLAVLGLPAPVTAGTFHAVALAQLRRRAVDRQESAPVLIDSKARLLAPLVPETISSRSGPARGRPDRRELLAAVAGEIEWAKGRLVGPDHYVSAARAAQRSRPLDPADIADIYARYEQDKRRRRVLDFDDLLVDLLGALEQEPDFAAAQRWQFTHLFVDELQDASTLQLRLVDAWLSGRSDLFAVGDPRQSVYAWNGADPEAILGFTKRYPTGTVLELETNYRSSPQVVAVASATVPRPVGEDGREPTVDGAMRLSTPRASRPDGPVPTLRAYRDEHGEAAGVASTLRLAHRPGRSWSRCAALARTNAQLDVLADGLRAAGVPSRRHDGDLLARPGVRATLGGLLRCGTGLSLRGYLAELLDAEPDPDPGLDRDDAGEAARNDLATLGRLGEEYLALDGSPSGEGFLAFVRTTTREGAAWSSHDAVDLCTFHRAKGLEWDVVCVTGLEDGFVPIRHARATGALEEERRLLYVALTRASDELHCSWAAERRFGSRTVARQRSPFLDAVEAACRRLDRLASPAHSAVSAALAESRAALDAASANGPGSRPRRAP